MNKYKEKLSNILNKIKGNKRVLYLTFCTVLILFCLVLNVTFSLMNQNKNINGANITIGDLKYKMVINEVTTDESVGTKLPSNTIIGDRIILLKAGKTEQFNMIFSSLNEIDTKYEIIYRVCTDVNCTSFIDTPNTIQISYHVDTPDVSGTISAGKMKSIILVSDSEDDKDYYVQIDLNVGYAHNELALTNQISNNFSPGSLEENLSIIAYVDGVEVETFPTEPNYETNIYCSTADGQTAARGLFRYSADKGWEVDIYGLNKSLTTCRVEFTKMEPVTYSILSAKLKCNNFNTTLDDSAAIIKYTGDCTLLNDSSLTGNGNWRIKFKNTGTYTLTVSGLMYIDVFLVGGGGAGGAKGGGNGSGGNIKLYTSVRLINNVSYQVVVGGAGSSSSFNDLLPATGGSAGGGAGGTGQCEFLSTSSSNCLYTDNGYSGHYGAAGSQTSYGGGKVGCVCCGMYNLLATHGGAGAANTGGGGAKGLYAWCDGSSDSTSNPGGGGSGIVIIRNTLST